MCTYTLPSLRAFSLDASFAAHLFSSGGGAVTKKKREKYNIAEIDRTPQILRVVKRWTGNHVKSHEI